MSALKRLIYALLFTSAFSAAQQPDDTTTAPADNSINAAIESYDPPAGYQNEKLASNRIVDLGYAKYEGVLDTTKFLGVTSWRGIRFAAPPVGKLRFRAPQRPKIDRSQVFKADKHGAVCLPVTNASGAKDVLSDEDCLFLDVYSPYKSDRKNLLPVVVWLQGGGFSVNGSPNLDGSDFASKGVVFVQSNYRVGPYGFLSSKEITKFGSGADLNVGLLDQRAVLKWVRQYIHKFGGDPKRVVIAGASAGGASVVYHLGAFAGRNERLFIGAIAESPSFGPQFKPAEVQYQFDALVSRANCTSARDKIDCLRKLPAAKLQEANIQIPYPDSVDPITLPPAFMYSPVIDGTLIPDYTYRQWAQGRFQKTIPLLTGSTENEGTLFVLRPNTTSEAAMRMTLRSNFPNFTKEQLDEVVKRYPVGPQFPGSGEYFSATAKAYGETRYNCAAQFLAEVLKSKGKRESYLYHYNVTTPTLRGLGLGVVHTQEMTALFGGCIGPFCDPVQPDVVRRVKQYWTDFITNLSPRSKEDGESSWLPSEGARQWLNIGETDSQFENVPEDFKERCAFWKSIGLELKQ